ncbi:MAG TPA: hypothetical protein VD867_10330 [Burkholderiales bacterium]|nr:hypothetical protein [Burkholderiales bacterium]
MVPVFAVPVAVVVEPVPRVWNPAAPLVELTGGVITTVDPVAVEVPVGLVVVPVVVVDPLVVAALPAVLRGGGAPAAPPSGKRQVTSRLEQKSGIEVRSVEASAA